MTRKIEHVKPTHANRMYYRFWEHEVTKSAGITIRLALNCMTWIAGTQTCLKKTIIWTLLCLETNIKRW